MAEKARPIPRFLAAAAWYGDGVTARFQLACLPGAINSGAPGKLIENVVSAAQESGLESIQYAELVPEGHVWMPVLQFHGFERLRSERAFETEGRSTWTRINRLFQRHQSAIPPTWHTDPIRDHAPETILALIAPHRLLPPEEIRHCWEAGAVDGFDLEMSCVLFDGQRPFGAFLTRRLGDILFVDVQVILEPNPRLRSLADLCLVYHVVRRVGPDGPIHWVRFRSGEMEHRQTANLALRMGGREVGRMHVFARRLRS